MIRWSPISIVSVILICLLLLRRCPISKKTRLSENKVSKDGVIPSASKLQKKNALHAENKRKSNRDDKHEITSLSSQLRMNSQCDEIEAGFEEDDETDDDLVINVASMENKGKALSGSTKRAKVSPKQNFKPSETQSTENKREEKKDRLLPKKKMKLISTKERDGNETVSTIPAEKGPLIFYPSFLAGAIQIDIIIFLL